LYGFEGSGGAQGTCSDPSRTLHNIRFDLVEFLDDVLYFVKNKVPKLFSAAPVFACFL
jgi:hypothetical protein